MGVNKTKTTDIDLSVLGRIMVPKDVHALVPGPCEDVTSHGMRHFADVNKGTDIETEG